MKIYEKIVLDIDGNVIEEKSFEYDGPVALAIPLVGAAIAAAGSAIASAGIGGTIGAGILGSEGITVSSLLTGVGTVTSLAGTAVDIAQTQGTAKANIKSANIEAQQEMDVATERSRRRLAAGESALSSKIATLGASGVDLSGSPLDVLMSDATNVKLGALDELYQGRIGASSKEYEASLTKYKSGMDLLSAGGSTYYRAGGAKTILGLGDSLGGLFKDNTLSNATYVAGKRINP